MRLVYNGIVKEGKGLHIFNRQKFVDEVYALFVGKQVVITVERKKKKRSLSQNNAY